MKLWLDDVRPMPPGYDRHVRTADEAIEALKGGQFDEVSLDHDLGEGCGTGLDVAKWIECGAHSGDLDRLGWRVHSMNPVGKAAMESYLRSADRFWREWDSSAGKVDVRPYRRICLYAGACGGKSVTARWLSAELSCMGYQCDYVKEFVKDWAYLGIRPEGYDQLHILGQQVKAEETPLRGGMDMIVTDSPLMLSVVYSRLYGLDYADEIAPLAFHPERKYRSLNLMLDRGNLKYSRKGRFQDFEAASRVDGMIADVLRDFYPDPPIVVDPTDRAVVLGVVLDAIGPPPEEVTEE